MPLLKIPKACTELHQMRYLSFLRFQTSLMRKMLLFHQGKKKKPASSLSDEFCEEQAFPYLLPKRKFDYNASGDIPIIPSIPDTWYFNQRVLNFNQDFSSCAAFILSI